MRTLLTLLFIGLPAFCAKLDEPLANPTDVRIIPVRPTPEPNNVRTVIQFPDPGQVVTRQPVKVQIRLVGFPLGVQTTNDRRREIYDDPMGQSMLVFVDNEHPIEIYKSFVDSLDENNVYYDLTLNTEIPFQLKDGEHLLRAFPDRSYGESLKGPGTFAATKFYINERKNNLEIDLNGPLLTYNEPLETMDYQSSKPILLDFYLTNVQLSRDGYKVRVLIDKNVERTLTQWVPYYIYGLKRGKHTVRLQLLDEKNRVLPGLTNNVERTITVR